MQTISKTVPNQRRHSAPTILIAMAAAILLLAAGCTRQQAARSAAGKPGGAPQTQRIPVRTEAVRKETIENIITVTGRVTASQEVAVVSKIQGRVASVTADTGAVVKKGQTLVTLESQDMTSQLQQAEAAYQTAQNNYDRMKLLFEEGAVSQQQWEQARLQLTQAEVALKLARSQLSNSVITAPISGIVTARRVDPGEVASPGQPHLTVMDTSKLYLEGSLTENQAAAVKAGQTVTVKVDAFPDRTFRGVVESIGPAGDALQRTFPVKILMTDDEPSLKPGMFGSARIPVERREGVVTVPVDAVVKHNGQDVVFITQNGIARMRKVQLGLSDGMHVEILKGLQEGEEVVVSGQHYLQDGTPVATGERSIGGAAGAGAGSGGAPSGAGGGR